MLSQEIEEMYMRVVERESNKLDKQWQEAIEILGMEKAVAILVRAAKDHCRFNQHVLQLSGS